jgi:hypothetical protein
MDRLTQVETEIMLRWFLYRADRATLDRVREEMPVFFQKAWREHVSKDWRDATQTSQT